MTEKEEFSALSKELTKQLTTLEKKNNGIYFTPLSSIKIIYNNIKNFIKENSKILEPSCGSCQFVNFFKEKFKKNQIVGVEKNETIFNKIKTFQTDKVTFVHQNYLYYNPNEMFDIIIGNPPYFVMKKNEVEKKYSKYYTGRPNIFILFIIKSLELLKDNGIMAFVLPKSFLNCLYYDKTRNYLQTFKIINIIECCDQYIETKQNTIIVIIQKNNNNHDNTSFVLLKNNHTIFGITKNIKLYKFLYNNSTTLKNLGFSVKVGNVVWNQCKDILTSDETQTLLIYSSDITNNNLQIKKYKNPQKKNYIQKQGSMKPLLVINRGYGNGEYKFNYCLLNLTKEYLVENHLICITYTKNITNEKLLILYKKIIKSFDNAKTKKYIQYYFGNNAINTKELCEMLPIYL